MIFEFMRGHMSNQVAGILCLIQDEYFKSGNQATTNLRYQELPRFEYSNSIVFILTSKLSACSFILFEIFFL